MIPSHSQKEAVSSKLITEPLAAVTNELLDQYFPCGLMLLIRTFGLAEPNARHRWIFKVILLLSVPNYWPTYLMKLIIGLNHNIGDLNFFSEIFWTIFAVALIDLFESIRKYLSQHVKFLLGKHVNVRELKFSINLLVYLGIFSFQLFVMMLVV